MIKNIVKILSAILLLFIIIVFYLSFFGIKTEKFNNQIINSISKNNKKINLNLNEVYYLLNPYNFSINIKTDNPQILLEGSKLEIKDIKTNISVRSLINSQFSIDDLEIKTKEIKLSDLIVLVRSFQNSPQPPMYAPPYQNAPGPPMYAPVNCQNQYAPQFMPNGPQRGKNKRRGKYRY